MTSTEAARLLAPWTLSAMNPRRQFPSVEPGQEGAAVEAWKWIAEEDGLYILTHDEQRSGLIGQLWVRWWKSGDGVRHCHVGVISLRPIDEEDIEQLARSVGSQQGWATFTIEAKVWRPS